MQSFCQREKTPQRRRLIRVSLFGGVVVAVVDDDDDCCCGSMVMVDICVFVYVRMCEWVQ